MEHKRGVFNLAFIGLTGFVAIAVVGCGGSTSTTASADNTHRIIEESVDGGTTGEMNNYIVIKDTKTGQEYLVVHNGDNGATAIAPIIDPQGRLNK